MKYTITLLVMLGMLIGSVVVSFGAAYDMDEGDVDCGTGTTQVVPAKGNRLFLSLQNNSDTTIWVTTTSVAAALNAGNQIFPGGSDFYDAVTPTGAVNCIHGGTGTKKLHWKQTK